MSNKIPNSIYPQNIRIKHGEFSCHVFHKKNSNHLGMVAIKSVLYFRSIRRGRYCFKNSNFGESRIWIKLEKIYRIVNCHKLTTSLMTILKLFKHKFCNLIFYVFIIVCVYNICQLYFYIFLLYFIILFYYIQTID